MLNREEILGHGLLYDYDDNHLLSTTYDLTIGRIVVSRDRATGEPPKTSSEYGYVTHYEVPPQGMALIVSREVIDLPGSITAIQFLKNTLSRKGLLAINTGVVDPNYSGPLSTVVVNFSNSPYPIERGDPFSRLVFFKHDQQEDIRRLSMDGLEHDSIRRDVINRYTSERSREFRSKIGGTFLNMKNHTEEIHNVALRTAVPQVAYFFTMILIGFAAIGLFLQAVNGLLNIGELRQTVTQLQTEIELIKRREPLK